MANRFEDSNSILIRKCKETQQNTNNSLKVWRSWTAQKGYDQNIENYEPEALNKILEVTNTLQLETESKKVRSKFLKVKSWYKRFGGS